MNLNSYNPEPLLNLKDVAKLCNVSTRTVRRWIRNKGFPGSNRTGTWRFYESEIKQWFLARRNKPCRFTRGGNITGCV